MAIFSSRTTFYHSAPGNDPAWETVSCAPRSSSGSQPFSPSFVCPSARSKIPPTSCPAGAKSSSTKNPRSCLKASTERTVPRRLLLLMSWCYTLRLPFSPLRSRSSGNSSIVVYQLSAPLTASEAACDASFSSVLLLSDFLQRGPLVHPVRIACSSYVTMVFITLTILTNSLTSMYMGRRSRRRLGQAECSGLVLVKTCGTARGLRSATKSGSCERCDKPTAVRLRAPCAVRGRL